jgi:hypothetical protein
MHDASYAYQILSIYYTAILGATPFAERQTKPSLLVPSRFMVHVDSDPDRCVSVASTTSVTQQRFIWQLYVQFRFLNEAGNVV